MKKIIVAIAGLILSTGVLAETNAGAGQKWYGPYTIAKVARYWDGGFRTSIHVNEVPETSCAVTNDQKKVSYFGDYTNNAFADSLFSAAATAQAQHKKVMLLLESKCLDAYGLNLLGVEIISE
ncbi:hypothetical protein BOO22_05570 [Vibrio cidicii]|uniref:hypothetical protein n=1 Tax=Vibrio cidicii TaxID=1763883 RepID=UPI0018C22664|nr:hypothetical protein [Vibrio cidicii]MBG0758878.1 hypothetical protein [Vibrio cidicii]